MNSLLTLTTHSPAQTQKVGRIMGNLANPGDVFLLVGTLGAGKTCLTQGIARGLKTKEPARSPTFILATQYQGRLTINHIDLYRIEDPIEAIDFGIEEYMNSEEVCVIEWADRTKAIFPEDCLWVEINYGRNKNTRQFTMYNTNERYSTLIKYLKKGADCY
jgi:tRNA threonylcarbamoyladenosine biosynthesis protein TsaE